MSYPEVMSPMCKTVGPNGNSLNSVAHGSRSASRMGVVISFLCMLMMSVGTLMATPEVSSMVLYDNDGNGEPDQLDISFTDVVDILDGDLGDGLPGIVVVIDDNGGAPYLKEPRHLEVVPGDYGATGVSSVSLPLVEDGLLDTGLSVYLAEKRAPGLGVIDVNGDGLSFAEGYISPFSQDAMSPVLIDVYTLAPDSGELTLVFSEPVYRSGGNMNLLVQDFVYNDNSGANVASISAMGADTDGTMDGRVTVLVNTMISPTDLGSDDISPLSSIEDQFGNPAASSPVALDEETGTGAQVEIFLADNARQLTISGSNLQYLATLELFSLQGSANLEILPMTVMGVPLNEVDQFQFYDDEGVSISSVFFLSDGIEDIVDLNLIVGEVPQLIHLAAGVFGDPGANVLVDFNTAGAVVDGGSNGGAGPIGFAVPVYDEGMDSGGNFVSMGPRDDAYGMTPADGALERVIVEYSYLQGIGFSFYAEVVGDLSNVASIDLLAPNGGALSFVNESSFYWSAEAPMDSFYVTKADMDAVFGSGAYNITVTYNDTSTEVISFTANPDVSASSPSIISPVAGEVSTPFTVEWSSVAGADFYEIAVEAPFNETRANEVFFDAGPGTTSESVSGNLDEGVTYEVFVSSVSITSASNVLTSLSDGVSVIVQSWNENFVNVNTGGGTAPGSVFVEADPNFIPLGTLVDGAFGVPVMALILSPNSSDNTVNLQSFMFDAGRDDPMADISQDISGANLVFYDINGSMLGEFPATIGSDNIEIPSVAGTVSLGNPIFAELVVDLVEFPIHGPMSFGFDPSYVSADLGAGYGPGFIEEFFEVGSGGFASGLVRDLTYEVGPSSLELNTTDNIQLFLNVNLGPNESGFDIINVYIPEIFDAVQLNGVSSASTNATLPGSFTPINPSAYTITPQPWGASVNLAAPVTSLNPNKFFRFSLSVTTSDYEVSERFDISVANSSELATPEYFGFADPHVNTVVVNNQLDPAFFQVISSGTDFGRNIFSVHAEVDTSPTSLLPIADEATGIASNNSETFKFAIEAELQAGDLGFNIISIAAPSELSVDLGSVAVTDGSGSPVSTLGANVQNGRLRIRLSSLIDSVGFNYLYVDVTANTGNLIDGLYFDVELNNSNNPANSVVAFEGNGELTEVLFWNSLFVPIDTSSLVSQGPSVTSLYAEVESANGYLDTGSTSESVTVNVLSDVSQGESGFDTLVLGVSFGFQFVGSVTVVDESGNTVSVTSELISSDPANGLPGRARLSFGSTQTSANLQVYASVSTSEEAIDAYFDAKVFNSGFAFSDAYANPLDVDGDGVSGELFQRVVAPVLNVANISGEVIYEVDVATSANTADLGFVSVDDVPVWRVFVSPDIQNGDAGYNQVRINLPFELDSSLPGSIKVYSANTFTVTDLNAWSANPLASGTDYTLTEDDPYAVKVRLLTTRTSPGEILVVTFSKRVTSYPSFMFADVFLNNSANDSPVQAFFGDADSDAGDRNDLGFEVQGSFSEAPNLTQATAELIPQGTPQTGETVSFSIYAQLDLSAGDQGVDTISMFYPSDLSSFQLVGVSRASSNVGLSGNSTSAYSTSSLNPGEFTVTFTQALTESKLVKLDFQAQAPTYPIFADFVLNVNNSSNFNEAYVVPGSVVTSNDVTFLGFEVQPSFSFDDLSDLVVSATAESLIALPLDTSGNNTNSFVEPNTQPTASLLVKVEVDSNTTAGFDVITIFAPPGFAMPSTFTVYKGTTADSLVGTGNILSNTLYAVNSDSQEFGEIRLEFENVQGNSAQDSTLYYRIDFQPTSPDYEISGPLGVVLTNLSNPLEYQPMWGNVADAATIYGSRDGVLDTDSLHVDVFYPFIESALPVVDDLVAEVNVVKASGNKGRTIQLSTEANYVVDFKAFAFGSISGFDRVGVELPFGFTEPSSITLQERDAVTGTFQSNVSFSSTFNTDSSRLILSLKDVVTDPSGSLFRLGFKTTSYDYSGPAYFFMGVDNSSAPSFFPAFPADVDGVANSNGLDIDVLPRALDANNLQEELDLFFTPIADDLVVEVTPQVATVSTNAQAFTVYVTADNIIGQRGFNRLTLGLPYDFENISNVTIYKTTTVTQTNGGFTKMATGAGISEVYKSTEDPEFGNIVRIDFSSTLGAGSDETIKVSFEADMPDNASFGEIFAIADDKAKSLPVWARPGDAHASSSTDESIIFVDPPAVDFSINLLSDFKSVVVAGNALSSSNVTGAPVAGKSSYVDLFMSMTKSATDAGIDVVEVYIPYPIDGNKLNVEDVSVFAASAGSSWTRLDPTKLEIKKSDFSLKVRFNEALTLPNDQEQLLLVRMPILAPDFSGLFYFGARGFSLSAPGLDTFSYVSPITGSTGYSMEVSVLPFVDTTFQDFAEKRPVSLIEAEIGPNFAPTSSSTKFTLAAEITVGVDDLGFDSIKVYLPGGYGTPGSVELSLGALPLLDPSQYSSEVSPGLLTVSLLDDTVTDSGNLFLSFSVTTSGFPEFGIVDLEVYDSERPLLSEYAGWGEVSSSVGSSTEFATMAVDVYADFTTISFVDPVEELYSEVNVAGPGDNGEAIAGQAMTLTTYLRASNAGNTAGGFDAIGFYLDPLFVNFPSTLSVNVDGTRLVAGTSTGYELDLSNESAPVIKLKSTYSSNVDIKISYTIDAPDEPREYFMEVYVDNSSVPRAFFPFYGFEDLDGDVNDGNSPFVSVFPEDIEIGEDLYVVEEATAEIVSDNLSVGQGGQLSLFVSVTDSLGSGNGFDRLGFRKDEALTFGQITLVKNVVSGNVYVRDVDYTVVVETDRVVIRFAEAQSVGSNGSYQVDFSLTAPDSPVELRFDAAVDNSGLRLPVFAFDGDANGVAGDYDSLFVSVLPDFTSALGDSLVIDEENLSALYAEAVFATGSSKRGEVSSTREVKLYVRPEFVVGSGNNGVNRFVVEVPAPFGKPSNLALYSGNSTTVGSANVALLEKGNVDYKATIGEDNRITLDFSGAQRDTWQKINYNNTFADNVFFIVSFDTVLPDLAEKYFLYVEADNKSLPIPRPAVFGDVNGTADDDGDGVEFSLNDNSLSLSVVPATLTSDELLAIENASSVVAEIIGATNGEQSKTVSLSLALNVTLADVSGNINRLGLSLPSEFTNLNGVTISRTLSTSANSVRLQEVTDYTLDSDDPTKVLFKFVEGQLVDALYVVSFSVTLPGRSSTFSIGAAVDNNKTPKRVVAAPGDTLAENGSGLLEFLVDPAAFSEADLVKTMVGTLTAKAALTQGDVLQVNNSGRIQVVANATFLSTDEGFDLIEISSFGLDGINDVLIKVDTASANLRQLFEVQDYQIHETPVGQLIELVTPISEDATITIEFTATAASDPQIALVDLVAGSTVLPVARPAQLSADSGASLGITIVPEKKSTDDLKKRPAKPVAGLSFDVAPASGNALSAHEVELYVNAQVTLADTTIGSGNDIETVPASSGFDQIFVKMPKQFGLVSGIELFRYADSTFTGNAEPLQEVSNFTFDVSDKNLVTIELDSSANLIPSGNTEGSFKVVLQTTLPSQPMTQKVKLAVDNSLDPNAVSATQDEFSGDSVANSKITVEPIEIDEATVAPIGTGAFVSLIYPQLNGDDDKPTPGEEPYAYTLRLQVLSSADTSGFDTVVIEYPSRFRNMGVSSVEKTSSANVVSSVPQGSTGFEGSLDEENAALFLEFKQAQASESGNTTFSYMDIELFGKMPIVPATYHHTVSLFNSTTGVDLDVTTAKITSDAGETGKLALKVEKNTTSSKYGYFGGGSGNILETFDGAIYAWDGTAFAANITQGTEAKNILVETQPTFSSNVEAGFDYLQIDLPYGSGEPSNVVVFFQSGNGSYVYLQEFYDYQIFTTPGDLTIEFSSVIDGTYVSDAASGVFSQVIGQNLAAEKLLVSFEMEMPNRLGRHVFDVFAMNTDVNNVVSDPFFVDPTVGEDRLGVQNLGAVSTVNRSATEDGTRFLGITVNAAASAVASVESVIAEIAVIGQEFVPVAASRQMRVDVSIESGGNTYNFIELQLPEGFNTVSGLVLNQGSTTLKEFVDYTLDRSHPRSVGVSFSADQSGTTVFDMTFNIETPASPPEVIEVSYLFGVVVSNVESGLLTTSPVFATGGDASLANSGSFKAVPLAVTLNSDAAVISGTVVLSELSIGATTGQLILTGSDNATYTESFQIAAGAGSYSFVISQTSDEATTFGVDAGSYTLSISIPQYTDTVTNVDVAGDANSATSVEGLVVNMTAESVQATLALDNAVLGSTTPEAVNMDLNFSVSQGVTLDSFAFRFVAEPGSVGYFQSFTGMTATMANTPLTVVENAVGDYSIDLNGATVQSPISISYTAEASVGQSGLYSIVNTLSTSAGNYLASSVSNVGSSPLFNVGDAISVILTDLPSALLGEQYLITLANENSVFVDETQVKRSELVFAWEIDPAISSSLIGDTSGGLGGTFTSTSQAGFSVNVTVSANGLTSIKQEYLLRVYKQGFLLSSVTPAVVPTDGGQVLIKGVGFTSTTTVTVGSTQLSAADVELVTLVASTGYSELLVTVPAISTGSYGLTVEDAGEFTGIPNPLNSASLEVAVSSTLAETATASVTGATASILDYNIVGLKGFYQGGALSILENALGSYDQSKWRAFGYTTSGYAELGYSSSNLVKPGDGFWQISRVSGPMSYDAVPAAEVPSYTVEVPAGRWALVSNIYDSAVVWESVTILSGTADAPDVRTVAADRVSASPILNANLYAMDNEATDLSRPYKSVDQMESGQGYWVQNKTTGTVLLQISKPTTVSKARGKAGVSYYKAGEDLPPEAPVTFSNTGSSSSAAGGGGGCLLR